MRLVVPLQGVVQGKGGLILGSLIPCALFYFLQFYLKRHRSPPSPSSSNPPSPSAAADSLPRSSSRLNLFARDGSKDRVPLSTRAGSIAKPNDSPYYIGLDRVRQDPYDALCNPNGIIQLGLSENRVRFLTSNFFPFFLGNPAYLCFFFVVLLKLTFDLLDEWLSTNKNMNDSLWLGQVGDGFSISGIAGYQPSDGLMDLKVVNNLAYHRRFLL